MYYIGLMSGTSMDAIDVALVRMDEQNAELVSYEQFPIPNEIQLRVRQINSTSSINLISELDVRLGELFADATLQLLDSSHINREEIYAIGSHGQTVLHFPEDDFPRTLQIGDANIIAYKTGITTVADFRRMDMAAGGQGAPLACAFHAWRFRTTDRTRAVLNIGGMANLTLLPADPELNVTGFDSGPGNALMDEWTQTHLQQDFDKNGEWAASGAVNAVLLNEFLDTAYFSASPPKSTGKDDFNLRWLEQKLARLDISVSNQDIQASLLELSARSISDALKQLAPEAGEVLVCGGGIHNTHLLNRLIALCPGTNIVSTASHGVDPDAMEAMVFAWLAKQRLDREPGNLPSVTGARRPVILGAIYQPVTGYKS